MLNKLVLFVEGQADEDAVPVLVKKVIRHANLSSVLAVEPPAFRVGGVERFAGKNRQRFMNLLKAAIKRKGVRGVLLLLDGDCDQWEGNPFCAPSAGRALATLATQVGAGQIFSFACVFACREYESWLLAGVESLAGKIYRDGLIGVKAGIEFVADDLEKSPRDAKGALAKLMESGSYKETIDQEHLTRLIDIEAIRRRKMKSFQRLENAIVQLGNAVTCNKHISTPAAP